MIENGEIKVTCESARRATALTRRLWSRWLAAVLQQPLHEYFAFLHFRNVEVFIRLVGRSMEPGPQMMAGMPICWKRPASVQ